MSSQEVPMDWSESIQDILDSYEGYSREHVKDIRITDNGPVIVLSHEH